MGTLDGKGALVTGGSRGIGRAIVKRLAVDGATVVFSYLQKEAAAQAVVREVAEAGGWAFAVQADQGSLEDLRRLSGQAEEHLDGLDIVVINAAGGLPGMIDEVTEDVYDRFMAAHAKGPFFLIQHAGRALRDGGRIIAISTLNTRLHPPGGALYTGAKGALENFTAVAALEFGGRQITANIVSPGATDTELLREANPGETFEDEVAHTALRPESASSVAKRRLRSPRSHFLAGMIERDSAASSQKERHPDGYDVRRSGADTRQDQDRDAGPVADRRGRDDRGHRAVRQARPDRGPG